MLPQGKASYTSGGGVALVTLVNPPANGYSHEMMRDLDEAILRARFDESVHAIVLAGAGEKFFCAGADIGMLGSVTPEFKYAFCQHANETVRLEQTRLGSRRSVGAGRARIALALTSASRAAARASAGSRK
jgi:enoyl-CoA hydratase/carnithine racemase